MGMVINCRVLSSLLMRLSSLILVVLLSVPLVHADEQPIRRGGADSESSRRRAIDGSRKARRVPEGTRKLTPEEQLKKETTRVINLIQPISCGTRNPGAFRAQVLALKNPNDRFNIEVWGNHQKYFVNDSILYFLRSNRTAYVTLFWVGPEGSVFVPFTNVKIEPNRDHKLDPGNIIVEPVGLERWRVFATRSPHVFPCKQGAGEFSRALEQLKRQHSWAAGRWDVRSHATRRSRFRLRRAR